MPNDDDSLVMEERVVQAQNGDRDALEDLLRDDYPRLMRLASSLIRDKDAAQDVLQESLIKVADKLTQLREPSAFSRWTQTILRREAFEFFRRQQRSPTEDAAYDDARLADPAAEAEPAVPAYVDLEHCLRRLRNDDRRVLNLHYWWGLETREIAAILGIAAGAVKTRLFRARARLRELLCEPGMTLASHR